MKKALFAIALTACLFVLTACAGLTGDGIGQPKAALTPTANPTAASTATPTAVAEYRLLSPEKAKEMMDKGGEYTLLDVRTQEEFDAGHIPGAKLIPDFELGTRAETELPDKDALILLYCRSGRRSANSAKALVGMGYTNVYDFGGIINWPYETQMP